MKRKFYIHRLRDIYAPGVSTSVAIDMGSGTGCSRLVRAVCEPYTAGSILAAWEVLCGRAYAFEWPKAGDIEQIIEDCP